MKKLLKYNSLKGLALLFVLSFVTISCEDFVEVDVPRNETVAEEVFSFEDGADAAVNAIYGLMTSFGTEVTFFDAGIEVYTGVLSDELTSFSSLEDYIQFSSNDINPAEPTVLEMFWREPYQYILSANLAVEGLQDNTAIEPVLRDQLLGEALFIRAYVHFYLLNLFGEIPYARTSDVFINTSAGRESVSQIYDNIIEDLIEAKTLLSEDFSFNENDERIRPNQDAATSLLARVYLYTEEWQSAVNQASEVLSNPLFSLKDNLNEVFLADSDEAIWQLNTIDPFRNNSTGLGTNFILSVLPPGGATVFAQTSLSDTLINSFEPGDMRFVSWIGNFSGFNYPFKYKNGFFTTRTGPEYTVMLRLAELYLIRSEANAQLGNLDDAINDLDVIRQRAELDLIQDTNPGISQSNLLSAIYKEKMLEFFAEGHRWFDLKRTGRANEVLEPLKADWQPTDVLLPIPENELFVNPNLGPQNSGY